LIISKTVQLVVLPDIPDPTKTLLVDKTFNPITNNLRIKSTIDLDSILMEVSDKFNNIYTDNTMASSIYGKVLAG
jgi:hypothetical protein